MASMFRLMICMGLALTFLGCQKVEVPEGFPELYPVTVQVIQDGQPLAEASVTLRSPDSQWSIGGVTNESGTAELWTHAKYSGAPVGKYKIVVTKQIVEEEPNPNHNPDVDNMPTFSHYFDGVDKQYGSPNTTPLELEVVAGNNPEASFDVGAAIKTPVK